MRCRPGEYPLQGPSLGKGEKTGFSGKKIKGKARLCTRHSSTRPHEIKKREGKKEGGTTKGRFVPKGSGGRETKGQGKSVNAVA